MQPYALSPPPPPRQHTCSMRACEGAACVRVRVSVWAATAVPRSLPPPPPPCAYRATDDRVLARAVVVGGCGRVVDGVSVVAATVLAHVRQRAEPPTELDVRGIVVGGGVGAAVDGVDAGPRGLHGSAWLGGQTCRKICDDDGVSSRCACVRVGVCDGLQSTEERMKRAGAHADGCALQVRASEQGACFREKRLLVLCSYYRGRSCWLSCRRRRRWVPWRTRRRAAATRRGSASCGAVRRQRDYSMDCTCQRTVRQDRTVEPISRETAVAISARFRRRATPAPSPHVCDGQVATRTNGGEGWASKSVHACIVVFPQVFLAHTHQRGSRKKRSSSSALLRQRTAPYSSNVGGAHRRSHARRQGWRRATSLSLTKGRQEGERERRDEPLWSGHIFAARAAAPRPSPAY